jgi:Cu+-exporting ATPase
LEGSGDHADAKPRGGSRKEAFDMTVIRLMRPVLIGPTAAVLLLAVYFSVLILISGREFALGQFGRFWYFILPLAAGFGIQIGLYTHLRIVTRHTDGSGKVVAVSGGTSTAAMISCCTHYLANVLPVLGATGLVALVAQYQTELFWAGLLFNMAGVVYVGLKAVQATQHMAQMEKHA